ncbi:MAG: 50S ribosomal protein L23 [Bacteroidetes bacterium GWF2_41_31]|jgi:large subunit ribosomal protein L23|nr:50S ribosomal protein L23 [Bacteroidota bacterium]OFY47511.1 MAG: 50S ribosomal protein L23 [Bacteroidetes bacterium GWF2_41_31]PIQ26508.1 MAG: 50S ribosomal protein L23 [Bacteroidetes bacterium CG18_big_fil_WC_8_21_14_2_50_41_14]PIY34182.1 MAG: 50S ribosomal protein L23 [Bacteroidetes bacterium CG_4_10_14_3_um_filter_42_6]PJB59072.1 MAG: 50S ribosomal protein L23 [Bacteroidetes bacterium CG_4_9_14_3_um_filter_41_19]
MGVIFKPVITEKMTAKGEKLNQFGFLVQPKANKLQIQSEVETLYGVQVVSVNTMNYSGKRKSRNTKSGVISGKTKAFKKAIITLAKGETIDFFSNI